jgi:hypothetical protein
MASRELAISREAPYPTKVGVDACPRYYYSTSDAEKG